MAYHRSAPTMGDALDSQDAAHVEQVRFMTAGLALARFEARALPWWHLLVGGAIALAVVSLTHLESIATAGQATAHVRLAMVPLTMAVAFFFDDPAGRGLRALPVGLGRRRLIRVLALLPVLVGIWAAVLAWSAAAQAPSAPGSPRTGFALPVWSFSLELAGLVSLTLAAAAVATRLRGDESGGLVAVPVLLLAVVGLVVLPADWALWPPYTSAPLDGVSGGAPWLAWLDAHRRWALLTRISTQQVRGKGQVIS